MASAVSKAVKEELNVQLAERLICSPSSSAVPFCAYCIDDSFNFPCGQNLGYLVHRRHQSYQQVELAIRDLHKEACCPFCRKGFRAIFWKRRAKSKASSLASSAIVKTTLPKGWQV